RFSCSRSASARAAASPAWLARKASSTGVRGWSVMSAKVTSKPASSRLRKVSRRKVNDRLVTLLGHSSRYVTVGSAGSFSIRWAAGLRYVKRKSIIAPAASYTGVKYTTLLGSSSSSAGRKVENSPLANADFDEVEFTNGGVQRKDEPATAVSFTKAMRHGEVTYIEEETTAMPNLVNQPDLRAPGGERHRGRPGYQPQNRHQPDKRGHRVGHQHGARRRKRARPEPRALHEPQPGRIPRGRERRHPRHR
nr:hypothetical protein [Tanacetum cinerariifolium]